jgi:Holliday junction resolvase-like predicted endonuclease
MNTEVTIQELRQLMKELTHSQKETDKALKKAISQFESQWGKLVESLVEGKLVNLLNSWGIHISDTSQRRSGTHDGKQYEFDIIAHNGHEIVIVEVKSTLNVSAVRDFLENLSMAKTWLHEYKDYKVYGAVAYLKADEKSPIFAERNGLFVIRATGDSASIINNLDFIPKYW